MWGHKTLISPRLEQQKKYSISLIHNYITKAKCVAHSAWILHHVHASVEINLVRAEYLKLVVTISVIYTCHLVHSI
jgi:hypothetical protein